MGRFDQSVPHLVELAHGMGTFDRWSLRPVEVAHLVGIAARAHLVGIAARRRGGSQPKPPLPNHAARGPEWDAGLALTYRTSGSWRGTYSR